MHFAAFRFLAMPRGFTAAILVSLCLVVTLAREAALGSDVIGVGCSATTACSTVAPSQTFPVLSAGLGVTQKAAGALRGRGTGDSFPAADRSAGFVSVRVVTRARGFLLSPARGVHARRPAGTCAGLVAASNGVRHHLIHQNARQRPEVSTPAAAMAVSAADHQEARRV